VSYIVCFDKTDAKIHMVVSNARNLSDPAFHPGDCFQVVFTNDEYNNAGGQWYALCKLAVLRVSPENALVLNKRTDDYDAEQERLRIEREAIVVTSPDTEEPYVDDAVI